MSMDESRQDRRFRCRIPATLLLPEGPVELLTSDVSHRGLHLRSDSPPDLRQVVRVRFCLPPNDAELVAQVMVIHVLEPNMAFDAPPGFGVQFVSLEGEARKTWEAFLRYVVKTYPTSEKEPVILAPKGLIDRIHRRHPRHHVEVQVHLETVDALKTLVTDDISRGGVFVRTELEVAPGSVARVHIVHPRSEEVFTLDGVVARVERGYRVGLAVQFTDITHEMRDALMYFIEPLLEGDGESSLAG